MAIVRSVGEQDEYRLEADAPSVGDSSTIVIAHLLRDAHREQAGDQPGPEGEDAHPTRTHVRPTSTSDETNVTSGGPKPAAPTSDTCDVGGMPRTLYAKSGDLSIAYQVRGDGPMDLVFVPGFVTHLEVGLEVPNIAAVTERLSSFARGITFDKRGTGLSDRTSGLPTLAERMDDIRAVMDAAGSERAAIVGMSEGGPAAALFAATYPERVSALVLWVSCLGPPLEERSEMAKMAVEFFDDYLAEHWGDGSAMRYLIGTRAPYDPAVDELLSRFERNSATPGAAQAVLRRGYHIDARPLCPAISVPTLLVAHPSDPVMPIDFVRDTAAAIPDARLVETDSPGHWSWDIGELADLDVIEEFLTGSAPAHTSEQVLATVLYTDIVASTERAFRIGDERWTRLLDQHDAMTRRSLERYRGREVNTTGDGFIAVFDGPARAVLCAQAILDGAKTLGIKLRAGLHTGECKARGQDLAGVTMHVGARVAAMAGPDEVLVSRTVRDLVSGSGIEFEPRGAHELKGVPEKWELFAMASAGDHLA
jgi:class 3 adenylate cyclase